MNELKLLTEKYKDLNEISKNYENLQVGGKK